MKTTKPKKFVFTLMPFNEKFDDVYKLGIKATCEELNTYCERVDEQIFKERILDRIYNQIAKADLVIADMSDRNPNVFYEVGYAHALGKDVILLTQNAEDIPFDLKHYSHIIYDGKIVKLKEELKKRLKWFLKEEKVNLARTNFNLEFYINGTKIENFPTIELSKTADMNGKCTLTIEINILNNSDVIFDEDFKIGLETPLKFRLSQDSKHEVIWLSDNKHLHVSKNLPNIFPFTWESYRFEVILPKLQEKKYIESFDIILKVFTRFQLYEMPFKLKIQVESYYYDNLDK